MARPIAYSPALETPEPDEAETSAGLRKELHTILETTASDYGHAVRSVHAKGHALVDARLEVLDDLPPELAQGLFAAPGRYDAILRFSTNPGDILTDKISVPRGVAIKIIGVEGDRLPGSEDSRAQDWVMINAPVFAATTAKKFLGNLKLLTKTTDRAEGAKVALSAVLRWTEKAIEAVGGESATLKTLGGAPHVHPLGEQYFTATAFRYGDHVAKLSLVPVSPSLTRFTGEEIAIDGRDDALREEIDAGFDQGGTWELRVQLCTDADAMPIEDATVEWDQTVSPYVTVARLTAAPQATWTGDASVDREDTLSFSPWHGLAAHQPLGRINRVRKPAYEMSADFRARVNGCPMHEPAVLAG